MYMYRCISKNRFLFFIAGLKTVHWRMDNTQLVLFSNENGATKTINHGLIGYMRAPCLHY